MSLMVTFSNSGRCSESTTPSPSQLSENESILPETTGVSLGFFETIHNAIPANILVSPAIQPPPLIL